MDKMADRIVRVWERQYHDHIVAVCDYHIDQREYQVQVSKGDRIIATAIRASRPPCVTLDQGDEDAVMDIVTKISSKLRHSRT